MPIYNEKYCEECYKQTMHLYVPGLTFEESYWKCTTCSKDADPVADDKYKNKSKEYVPGYVKALRSFSS